MEMDVGNQQMLTAGATFRMEMHATENWRPISAAPHDGTVIEVRCTYGVAPWYGLYRWTDTRNMRDQNGEVHEWKGSPGWVKVGEDARGFTEDSSFTWRPYSGPAVNYVDPTGGAQNSAAYWRGAVAAKRGLPLDYFEKDIARNAKPKRGGFWQWLIGAE